MTETIILLTGASRGLGFAIGEALAEKGAHIIAVAKTTGGLEELDDKVQLKGGSATLVPLDVTDYASVERLGTAIAERWGKLDLWVHTAIQDNLLSPVAHITTKDFEKSLKTNVLALQKLISITEPLLRHAHGTALFLDDPVDGNKFQGIYGASKAAQRALIESWEKESEQLGPKVILHQPNPMPTALRARFHPGEDKSTLSHPSEEAARILQLLKA